MTDLPEVTSISKSGDVIQLNGLVMTTRKKKQQLLRIKMLKLKIKQQDNNF